MKQIILVLACTTVGPVTSVAQAPQSLIASGLISGTIRGADGSLISSGAVSASRIPDAITLPKSARTAATVAITSAGTFQMPPLVYGVYQICTQTSGAWLSDCEWGTGTTTRAFLSVGQASTNVNIALRKGALITVRVEDPGQLFLASAAKSTSGLLLGVSTDSFAFRRAALVGQDAGGRTYQLLVPFDRQIRVSATSSLFQVGDAIGLPLATSGIGIQVLAASNQPLPTVTLRVTGRTNP